MPKTLFMHVNAFCEEEGISHAQAAKRFGMSASHLVKVLDGTVRLSTEVALKISEGSNYKVDGVEHFARQSARDNANLREALDNRRQFMSTDMDNVILTPPSLEKSDRYAAGFFGRSRIPFLRVGAHIADFVMQTMNDALKINIVVGGTMINGNVTQTTKQERTLIMPGQPVVYDGLGQRYQAETIEGVNRAAKLYRPNDFVLSSQTLATEDATEALKQAIRSETGSDGLCFVFNNNGIPEGTVVDKKKVVEAFGMQLDTETHDILNRLHQAFRQAEFLRAFAALEFRVGRDGTLLVQQIDQDSRDQDFDLGHLGERSHTILTDLGPQALEQLPNARTYRNNTKLVSCFLPMSDADVGMAINFVMDQDRASSAVEGLIKLLRNTIN